MDVQTPYSNSTSAEAEPTGRAGSTDTVVLERPRPSSPAKGVSRGGPRNRPHLRRRLTWLGASLLAIVATGLLLRPSPLEVEVAAVARGPLEVTIDAEGVTRVRDLYRVAAPVGGRLYRIRVREGDRVAAGAELARIAPAPLDPRVTAEATARLSGALALAQEAAARVEQTRAAFEQATRHAGRLRVVADAGAVSRETMERAELELATAGREHLAARSRERAASSEVQAARAALMSVDPPRDAGGVSVVRAPAPGRVLRIHEASERVIPSGSPLLEIADAGEIEVVTDVLSTDAVQVRPGAPIRIVGWGGDAAVAGRVRTVEPSGFTKVSALGVEEQRVNVVADLDRLPPGLGDGYRVDVQIVTWLAPGVVKVPNAALIRSAEGWRVFMVEEGRARLRRVAIGHRGADEAEVRSGLRAGDEVVLFPPDALENGTRVHTGRR